MDKDINKHIDEFVGKLKVYIDHNIRMANNYLGGNYSEDLLESDMEFSLETAKNIKEIISNEYLAGN